MNFAEKLLALSRAAPFACLSLSELAPVAEVSRLAVFRPGEPIGDGTRPLGRLLVVVAGAAVDAEDQPLPRVLGASSVLFEQPLPCAVFASRSAGVSCLAFKKAHVLTILNECPGFSTGLLSVVRGGW
ncbi:MAG: hypothetical protein HYV63_14815 [Candidatus Schekmanbacteria bacterium]|nr:hypothetical protein [Candidatus Schekmanbacteria bacterium]